jgi:hypothetical protein
MIDCCAEELTRDMDFEDPGRSSATLPAFIRPLSTRLTAEDVGYLQAKGAFCLPTPECRESLIWCFFEYVYPFMPVVDLDEIVHAVEDPFGRTGGMSLLLLQAILFAGVPFVPLLQIHSIGIASRQKCREVFFKRVQVSLSHPVPMPLLFLSDSGPIAQTKYNSYYITSMSKQTV